MVFKCCVPGCNNYNNESQMHGFPKDPKLYDLWITRIGRMDLKEKEMERVRKSYRVCNSHFGPESQYIGSRHGSTIRKDAIPTWHLNNPINKAPENLAGDHELTRAPAEQSIIPSIASCNAGKTWTILFTSRSSPAPIHYKPQLKSTSTPVKVADVRKRVRISIIFNSKKNKRPYSTGQKLQRP